MAGLFGYVEGTAIANQAIPRIVSADVIDSLTSDPLVRQGMSAVGVNLQRIDSALVGKAQKWFSLEIRGDPDLAKQLNQGTVQFTYRQARLPSLYLEFRVSPPQKENSLRVSPAGTNYVLAGQNIDRIIVPFIRLLESFLVREQAV